MPIFRSNITRQEKETKARLDRIHRFYLDHPGCTINDAVTFIPETKGMVERYSKNRKIYENV